MLLSIIIVNYNTFQITCNCIASIRKYTRQLAYEIILVDNASTECPPGAFLAMFPDIKLICNPLNNGFAKGNNLGLSAATGDIVLLLNSDTYLTEDSLSRSISVLNGLAGSHILSCRLNYENGVYQKNARKFRSVRNELLDLCRPLLYLLPYRKRAQLMLNQYFKGDFDTECDWVSGAFMMFYRRDLEKLPGQKLDERFFMYGEDQLWCYQFQQLGIPSYFTAATAVVHIANASTDTRKRLQLEKTMLRHELRIMSARKGKSVYYYLFAILYTLKTKGIYAVKLLTR